MKFKCEKTDETSAQMSMFGPIGGDWLGGGITEGDVSNAIKDLGPKIKTLNITMDSPGGIISEGFAIYNLLAQSPLTVNINVIGWAASAASVVLMAADKRTISEGGMVMVHEGWVLMAGNKGNLRAAADLLEKLDGQISLAYQRRTGNSAQQIKDWVEAETWFTGQEAVDSGFADAVIPFKQAEDSSDRELMAKFAAHYQRGKEMLEKFIGSREQGVVDPIAELRGYQQRFAALTAQSPYYRDRNLFR